MCLHVEFQADAPAQQAKLMFLLAETCRYRERVTLEAQKWITSREDIRATLQTSEESLGRTSVMGAVDRWQY